MQCEHTFLCVPSALTYSQLLSFWDHEFMVQVSLYVHHGQQLCNGRTDRPSDVPISLIDCPYGNNAVIQLIPELHQRSFYTVFV